MLEMTKLIPRLVRDFDFELDNEVPKSDGRPLWTTQNVWFVKPTNFQVRIKPRVNAGGS